MPLSRILATCAAKASEFCPLIPDFRLKGASCNPL